MAKRATKESKTSIEHQCDIGDLVFYEQKVLPKTPVRIFSKSGNLKREASKWDLYHKRTIGKQTLIIKVILYESLQFFQIIPKIDSKI